MAYSIPQEIIGRIKDAANIVEVVSDTVVLKKAGRNHLGLCPFHAEKTPSFTVSEEKQIYYCFGCGKGGNVFSFLMQQEGLSFPDAVRSLATRYSIELPSPQLSPAQKKQLSEKERLYQINEMAATFYGNTLKSPQTGQRAMGYLLGRGMTQKIIDGFHLGYAPDGWDGLLRHGQSRRLDVQGMLKSGLIIERKDRSGHYDRFRSRIMFPIYNGYGQVIGFGGRVMGDDLPKYLNSPETPVYNKGNSLYGLHRARTKARNQGVVYVVEGYFDVLAMHLYGIENTVASLGTALTLDQVQLLKGLVGISGKAVLVYDADQAGIKAAQRSIPIFEQGLLEARILVLPRGYDPDLYLREFGPDAFFKASQKAATMMLFLMESLIEQHELSLAGKVKIVAALEKSLAAVQDTVARSLYIKQLAERLDIDETAILEKIRHAVPGTDKRTTFAQFDHLTVATKDSQRLEHQMIAMLLQFPEIKSEFIGRNLMENFEDAVLQQIAVKLVQNTAAETAGVADMLSEIEDERYRNLVARLSVKDDQWDHAGCERLMTQFGARHFRRTNEDLQRRIIDAEKNNDIELLSKLLRQKQQQASKKGLINSISTIR